jgi:hypothetical protein
MHESGGRIVVFIDTSCDSHLNPATWAIQLSPGVTYDQHGVSMDSFRRVGPVDESFEYGSDSRARLVGAGFLLELVGE